MKTTRCYRQWVIVLLAMFSLGVSAQNDQRLIRTGVKGADAIVIESGIDSMRVVKKPSSRRVKSFDDNNPDHGASDVWYSYEYYKYAYPSINSLGQEVYLTALAAMPLNATAPIHNVVLGCHVTITDNASAPSSYLKEGSVLSDVGMLLGHADRNTKGDPAYNCLVILPDYQGYGNTKDEAHPYLIQEVTARQTVDALRYGLELYQSSQKPRPALNDNWKTVCVGYSQGGAVAMAAHRFMETNFLANDLHLGGSVCGDGPYDPIATMHTYVKEDKVYLPVALPLIVKGMLDYSPYMRKHRVEDYFTEKFLATGILDWIAEKKISTSDVQKALKKHYRFGRDSRGEYIKVSEVFTPEAFAYIRQVVNGETPEPNAKYDDLMKALAVNDLTHGWKPQHPIYLFHSKKDEVVPFVNAEVAVSRLNSTGGPKMVKLESVASGNHVDNGRTFYFSLFGTAYEEKGFKAIVGGADTWNQLKL